MRLLDSAANCEPGFDDVVATLDLIAGLPVRVVVPGHGAPFADVGADLQRARARLAGLQADPARHARHALNVLLKYHQMEERSQAIEPLVVWAEDAPLVAGLRARFAPRGVASARAWIVQVLEELVAAGALRRDGDVVHDT